MQHRIQQLSRDTIIYGVGGVIAKGVGFLLLPIYTRLFTPMEFGTIEMLTVVSGFLGALLNLGLDSSQSFYFFEQKCRGQKSQGAVITAILRWRLLWGGAIVLSATLLSPLLNRAFFLSDLRWEYFAVCFSGVLLSQVMSQGTEVFRLLFRPLIYIGLTLGQAVLSALIALTLIMVFDKGIIGFFVGGTSASLIVAMFGWYLLRHYLIWSDDYRAWWGKVLKFGVPLFPAGLAMYALNTADRWFISHFHGQAELGVYAVGAKFAMLVALAVETFRKAWWPMAMSSMHEQEGPQVFQFVARLYTGLASSGVVLLTVLSPWLVRLVAGPGYQDSFWIVGVLAWYSVFYGLFLIVSAGIWKVERTLITTWLTIGALIINIALNYLLVPKWGGFGAACATSLAFLIWCSASVLISERYWKIGFPLALLGIQTTLGIAATAIQLWQMEVGHAVWQRWGMGIVCCALLLTTALPKDVWKNAISQLLWNRIVRLIT